MIKLLPLAPIFFFLNRNITAATNTVPAINIVDKTLVLELKMLVLDRLSLLGKSLNCRRLELR